MPRNIPDKATLCGACLKHPPYFNITCAALSYAAPVDQLIIDFKYRGKLALGQLLAGLLASALQERRRQGGLDDPAALLPDILLPVPLHRARLAERGFNQSLEIARGLGKILDVPMAQDVVLRIRDTTTQVGLPLAARQDNIRSAFHVRSDVAGLRIAVVDDVMTTGATLNELARTLRLAGARSVVNLVAARTPESTPRHSDELR